MLSLAWLLISFGLWMYIFNNYYEYIYRLVGYLILEELVIIFSIEECREILSKITPNDVIVSPHFNVRLKGRGLDVSSYYM